MRNMLVLLAAFTLSTSAGVSVVACGSSTSQTTPTIFQWNDLINGQNGKTASEFFEDLLENPDIGVGQTLYKDIIDYISLSILKTNPIFESDYQFARLSVENQITNTQDSLKAKYGHGWEKQWNKFLKDPAQGGDGQIGSYQRYFDILLKSKANTIVTQYYVNNNYHNYQYYSSTEISIWLNDMYNKIKPNGNISDYLQNGIYKNRVWIVARSVSNALAIADAEKDLETAIHNAASANNILLINQVAKTKNDQELQPGENYLIDPSNTIKGLLSNQQVKIAQVWMKNQGPIWTRQIVVPFNDNIKNKALKTNITADSFSDQAPTLTTIINDIQTNGFDTALKNQSPESIKSVTNSAETGDLGLVTLNSEPSNIKPSFLYYLYRYVTSSEGVGQNTSTSTIVPYQLSQADTSSIANLLTGIDRTRVTNSNNKQTSQYNDLVWMNDNDAEARYSGNGQNKVAIFIDADGIHFVQTPGITYTSTVSTEPIQETITKYSQLISNEKRDITWNDVKNLSDRPGGLTNNPYLDFLQTQYLLWNANNSKTYFDLNESIKNFTSGSSDISSNSWWDYILFFNKVDEIVHWNLPELLNTEITASGDKIYDFVQLLKNWFDKTSNLRIDNLQKINLETLVKNINDLNNTWDNDKETKDNGPPARLNAEDIKSYLDQVAGQTIWWYDSNNIKS